VELFGILLKLVDFVAVVNDNECFWNISYNTVAFKGFRSRTKWM